MLRLCASRAASRWPAAAPLTSPLAALTTLSRLGEAATNVRWPPGCCVPRAEGFGVAGARSFAVKVKARSRGNVYVSRKVSRLTLYKATRKHQDPTLLLPPYVSASELRVLFRLDYAGAFRLLGVRTAESKYFWKDFDGREFETASKRKVLVPFDLAAIPAQGVGLRPHMVDVEPDWDRTAAQWSAADPVPVVAVLGHINHGKTTLLDALCGTDVASMEPGGITQGVRAMTGRLVGDASVELNASAANGAPAAPQVRRGVPPPPPRAQRRQKFDPERMTFMDTPGHEAFELQRGRTMAAADVALVVVSVEHGAEVQTEEVLLHAAKWKVPVVFALNKIDLPDAHIELTRAELRRQCQVLLETGQVDVDWTREAEEAVPISALQRWRLEELVGRIRSELEKLPQLPLRLPEPPSLTPGEARRCQEIRRRTDFLVGIETAPSAVALVVEVERGAETGETVLTLIIRAGRLTEGQYFAVGTAFGRISYLAVAVGSETRSWARCDTATAGVAVQVMGLRNKKLGGDCATDDLLYALPRERAWRLSEHRRRIETLSNLQTAGPPIEAPWEFDGFGQGTRTQAAFDRDSTEQPERHSKGAYRRRMEQPAVEEVSAGSTSGQAAFRSSPRSDFSKPLGPASAARGRLANREEVSEDDEPQKRRSAQPRASAAASGGRKSRRRSLVDSPDEEDEAGPTGRRAPSSDPDRRFQVLRPGGPVETEGGEDQADDAANEGGARSTSGGRRSSKVRPPTGAWTARAHGPGTPQSDFVYYTDRTTWEEEADIDNTRKRFRWQSADQARWEEQKRQEGLRRQERHLAEAMRREVFGEPPLEEDPKMDDSDRSEDSGEDSDEVEPLPPRNVPVMPIILKTKSMSQFDVLMDEIERVQAQYGVRIVIVHGGLGPVIPKDVVHAEVEKQYGFCPIYAFQVGINPAAVGQAEAERIDIRRYDVFTDLVSDLADRCERMERKKGLRAYTETLREEARSAAP